MNRENPLGKHKTLTQFWFTLAHNQNSIEPVSRVFRELVVILGSVTHTLVPSFIITLLLIASKICDENVGDFVVTAILQGICYVCDTRNVKSFTIVSVTNDLRELHSGFSDSRLKGSTPLPQQE